MDYTLKIEDALSILKELREAQEACRVAYKNDAANKAATYYDKRNAERKADGFLARFAQ